MRQSVIWGLATAALLSATAGRASAQDAPKAAVTTESRGTAEVPKAKAADETSASPGMKPDLSKASPAEPGARKEGENVGVAPGTNPAAGLGKTEGAKTDTKPVQQ